MAGISGWCATLLALLAAPAASGGTLTTLYSFAGGGDGATPLAGLVANGTLLYGTTSSGGGAHNYGTIFSFDMKSGRETVLYRFQGSGTDGANPVASLVLSPTGSGVLYGTTEHGGGGFGTVFAFDLGTNIETVLYQFAGGLDGANPVSPLVLTNGLLFGTTSGSPGGECSPDCGTLFQLDPKSGAEMVLHVFTGAGGDGGAPGNLQLFGTTFYGTTMLGGASNNGILYEFGISQTPYQLLHDFEGGVDGANPAGALILNGKFVYGTTEFGGTAGGGTLFKIGATGKKYQVVNDFTGTNGSMPLGGLTTVVNGTPSLHRGIATGATLSGGGPAHVPGVNLGTIFSFDLKKKAETVQYNFSGGADGSMPVGTLLEIGGAAYGTTSAGGANGLGTVFKLTVP
jgi:uncharacterized repeat protein (TIGR03803 family)